MSDGKRLKFEEACAELGISEAELEQLVARGEIASVKEGDSLFIKREVLESYKSQSDEPAILLSDEEINLLEDDDIDLGIDLEEPAAAPEVAASMSVDAETDKRRRQLTRLLVGVARHEGKLLAIVSGRTDIRASA